VLKALAKAPADRFQTGDEMGEAIEMLGQRLRAAPSTAMLARYLRELFGPRREAWRTVALPAIAADKVTVTAEPVPERITVSLRGPVDHRLEAVPALGPNTTAETRVFKLWHRMRTPVAILIGLLFVSATIAVVIAASPTVAKVPAGAPAVPIDARVIDAPVIDAVVIDAAGPAPAIVPVDAGPATVIRPPPHKVPKPAPPKPKPAPPSIDCKKDPMACP
jgi:hypothetical protein